ncbi:hypothetical protein VPHK479_0086 [Vibrio phage K479]
MSCSIIAILKDLGLRPIMAISPILSFWRIYYV